MDGPFIFIGTHAIKEGKLEEFKRDCEELARVVEEMEPQLASFNFFFNEEETEVSVVHVHPNADSMLTHMRVAREHITQATDEQLQTKEIQILGPHNDAVRGMIEQLSQEGVPLVVKPLHFAGFLRSS